MRRFRSLVDCDRGASVIELALVVPVLSGLLIGMVDLSRAYSTKLQLEQAAQRTIEKVMQEKSVSSDYSASLKTEGASAAGVAESAVTPDNWLECDGARAANFTDSCTTGQTYARYVSVSIDKSFSPMFGTRFFPGANSNGTMTITAEAGLRIQ
jgi:Flp pilus assembly protein TadG